MHKGVLVDNDVLLKVCCYDLAGEAVAATTIDGTPPSMLGVGRYVIRGRLNRARNILNRERACVALDHLLNSVNILEPSDAELSLAADLEAKASQRGLELDGGESQLLAILVLRGCSLLLTGDKRAITAIAATAVEMAACRVGCLEQLIAQLITGVGVDGVRSRVCSEPKVDTAVTICFACTSEPPPSDHAVAEGLLSYIHYLNGIAPSVLFPGPDLTGLAAQ